MYWWDISSKLSGIKNCASEGGDHCIIHQLLQIWSSIVYVYVRYNENTRNGTEKVSCREPMLSKDRKAYLKRIIEYFWLSCPWKFDCQIINLNHDLIFDWERCSTQSSSPVFILLCFLCVAESWEIMKSDGQANPGKSILIPICWFWNHLPKSCLQLLSESDDPVTILR